MSKFDLSSISQMESPIMERIVERADSRQPVEFLNTHRKRKRVTQVNRNKTNYAKIISNIRVNRVKESVRVNMIAIQARNHTTPKKPILTPDKKSFTTGLLNILVTDLLGELTTEDSQLGKLRKHILAKDRESSYDWAATWPTSGMMHQ